MSWHTDFEVFKENVPFVGWALHWSGVELVTKQCIILDLIFAFPSLWPPLPLQSVIILVVSLSNNNVSVQSSGGGGGANISPEGMSWLRVLESSAWWTGWRRWWSEWLLRRRTSRAHWFRTCWPQWRTGAGWPTRSTGTRWWWPSDRWRPCLPRQRPCPDCQHRGRHIYEPKQVTLGMSALVQVGM